MITIYLLNKMFEKDSWQTTWFGQETFLCLVLLMISLLCDAGFIGLLFVIFNFFQL